MSKKALKNGHAEHIHSNCDCEYAVRFDGESNVAGYDPQKYEDMYYGADGDTPKERINAMRRADYVKNKDKINEQKSVAYSNKKLSIRLENVSKNAIIYADEQIAQFIENPSRLGDTSPKEKYDDFINNGVDVKPLSRGSLQGVPFEDGGGYKVNGAQDGRYLQYHPKNGSHHKDEYYKLSSGKSGTKRYNIKGEPID